MGTSTAPVNALQSEWLETVTGDWIRRSAIVALSIPDEDKLTVGEVMHSLTPEEREDFLLRHPLPERPSG